MCRRYKAMTPEKRFLSAYWKAKQAPRSEEGNHSDAFSRFASEAATWIKDVESAAFNAGLEAARAIAAKRRDTWRAEADTYSEDNQAKFVRNMRAGEAQQIFAEIGSAIRARLSQKEG